jgi:hypothetical protein
MSDNLKAYALMMGLGAVIGITIAEGWRRAVHHDSYADYLPPVAEREAESAETNRPEGRMRAAANRLWSPVAATAGRDLTRLRRVRAGAPKPTVDATAPPTQRDAPSPSIPAT